MIITAKEKKKYVLSTDADLEILKICKKLEQQKLSAEDKRIVKLIKTQLQKDWRNPLLTILHKLSKKYGRTKNKKGGTPHA